MRLRLLRRRGNKVGKRRIALEAFALEGYRADILSESDLRRMLGFESRLDVHAFLKQHGVYLQYGLADLERDLAAAKKIVAAFKAGRGSRKARQE